MHLLSMAETQRGWGDLIMESIFYYSILGLVLPLILFGLALVWYGYWRGQGKRKWRNYGWPSLVMCALAVALIVSVWLR